MNLSIAAILRERVTPVAPGWDSISPRWWPARTAGCCIFGPLPLRGVAAGRSLSSAFGFTHGSFLFRRSLLRAALRILATGCRCATLLPIVAGTVLTAALLAPRAAFRARRPRLHVAPLPVFHAAPFLPVVAATQVVPRSAFGP